MSGPGDLFDLCLEYLDACAAAVATTVGGPIPPEAIYVTPGPPAWDCCPGLTVYASGPAEGTTAKTSPPLEPMQRTRVQGLVEIVTVTATVLRCSPSVEGGQAPSGAEIQAAAEETTGDVWAIRNHCRNLIRAGALFARPSGRREVQFLPAVAVNPMGGCAGWQVSVNVQLDGYTG